MRKIRMLYKFFQICYVLVVNLEKGGGAKNTRRDDASKKILVLCSTSGMSLINILLDRPSNESHDGLIVSLLPYHEASAYSTDCFSLRDSLDFADQHIPL